MYYIEGKSEHNRKQNLIMKHGGKKMTGLKKIPVIVFYTIIFMFAVIAVGCGKKEESYRTIQVYNIEGKAWVTRENVGEMEMYANMQLQSNDQVKTEKETYVQLKLDEDKYILLEPETSIKIQAEGNAQDSKTKIVLESGGIVNRIENELSKNSSYEIETPNSTMAVRGTIFRIKLVKDERGKIVSEVEVQDGKVECRIVVKNEDGSTSEQMVELEAGKKNIIEGTPEGADYVSGPMEYTYETYENEVLSFILAIGNDNNIVDSDKLDAAKQDEESDDGDSESKNTLDKEVENQDKKESNTKEEAGVDNKNKNSENLPKEEEIKEEQEEEKKEEQNTIYNNTQIGANSGSGEFTEYDDYVGSVEDSGYDGSIGSSGSVEGSGGTGSTGSSGTTEGGESTEEEKTLEGGGSTEEEKAPEGGENTEEEKTPEGGGSTEEEKTPEGGGSNENEGTTGDDGTTEGGDSTVDTSYVITFKYNNVVFATQSVVHGTCASEPVLMPTTSGAWYLGTDTTTKFAFDTTITTGITLIWLHTPN